MDHSELVAEMPHVEKLSTQERLHLARKRRLQQLKVWAQREKEWNKHHKNSRERQSAKKIYFSNSVMLLEAAARNDIEEGTVQLIKFYFKTILSGMLSLLLIILQLKDC